MSNKLDLMFDVESITIPTVNNAVLQVTGKFVLGRVDKPREGEPHLDTLFLNYNPITFSLPKHLISKDIREVSYQDVLGILQALGFDIVGVPTPPEPVNLSLPPDKRNDPEYNDELTEPMSSIFSLDRGEDDDYDPTIGAIRLDHTE